jgi:hypothetical protein
MKEFERSLSGNSPMAKALACREELERIKRLTKS